MMVPIMSLRQQTLHQMIAADQWIEQKLLSRLEQYPVSQAKNWQHLPARRTRLQAAAIVPQLSVLWLLDQTQFNQPDLQVLAHHLELPLSTLERFLPWLVQRHLQMLIASTANPKKRIPDSGATLEQERRTLHDLADIKFLDYREVLDGRQKYVLFKVNHTLRQTMDEYCDRLRGVNGHAYPLTQGLNDLPLCWLL